MDALSKFDLCVVEQHICFRYISGLTLDNVTVETYREDKREDFIFENVK